MPAIRRVELPAPGPEDVVFDAAGRILTGLDDGSVVRIDPQTGLLTTLANTGGRPLGLEVCDDGSVLVCDCERGLLRLDPGTGALETLVSEVGGERLSFVSNAVQGPDGTIWFSTSTRRFDLGHYMGDILEHSGTGRLFRRDPSGTVETVLDGLQFANGVVLAPDGSCVLVAETGAYRIDRLWIEGPRAGERDTLIDNLPGFPDNMLLGSDGLIWVGLPTARNPLLDRLLPLPGALRQLVWLLPDAVQPAPTPTAWVLGIGLDGTVVHDLQVPGVHYSFVTSAAERDGLLVLGSVHDSAVALTSVPVS